MEIITDLLVLALRVLFLIAAPIILAALCSGLLVGIFQAATTVRDNILSYSAKLLAVLLVTYLFLSSATELLLRLATEAWS